MCVNQRVKTWLISLLATGLVFYFSPLSNTSQAKLIGLKLIGRYEKIHGKSYKFGPYSPIQSVILQVSVPNTFCFSLFSFFFLSFSLVLFLYSVEMFYSSSSLKFHLKKVSRLTGAYEWGSISFQFEFWVMATMERRVKKKRKNSHWNVLGCTCVHVRFALCFHQNDDDITAYGCTRTFRVMKERVCGEKKWFLIAFQTETKKLVSFTCRCLKTIPSCSDWNSRSVHATEYGEGWREKTDSAMHKISNEMIHSQS